MNEFISSSMRWHLHFKSYWSLDVDVDMWSDTVTDCGKLFTESSTVEDAQYGYRLTIKASG